ncbi:ATP-dependent DNA helicase [Salininema proteolyticum]|uniref:DNA 5'-3' helicase n=1 Tax=Salininema proteolyticum TaxID=1607685 RepID=A0ABV8TXM2_9ACTN
MTSLSSLDLLDAVIGRTPSGEARPGQRQMAEAVEKSAESGRHLIVQAGTGTGKSLAYLCAALASGKRVVIATATLALQAQLVNVDLPRLVKATAPLLGRAPTFSLLKGRNNYLCHAKMAADEEEDAGTLEGTQQLKWASSSKGFAAQVKRLYAFANETDSGDRDDLDPGVSDQVWRQASTSSSECPGATKCDWGTECFSEMARARAMEADIVVTNHALLTIDMFSEGTVLPEHDLLIIDEAHELADRATSAARAELSPARLEWLATRSRRILGADIAGDFNEAADQLRMAIEDTGEERIKNGLPEQLDDALTLVTAACNNATTVIKNLAKDDKNALVTGQIRSGIDEARDCAVRARENSGNDVIWCQPKPASLIAAPLFVGGLLAANLYESRTVVATSATLTLGGTFDTVARSLGLGIAVEDDDFDPPSPTAQPTPLTGAGEAGASRVEWDELDVGSPFDYRKQGILYVASHLPRPGKDGSANGAMDELVDLIEASGGGALCLFSSRRAADEAADALRGRVDYPVMVQGEETLSTLVRQFKEDRDSCLLGVMSLWQGVDVPGDSCRLVVIDRIPFPRPNEPLTAARTEASEKRGRSGFMDVSVPVAAQRIAQGAGRLIRRSSDRGVVAVLDSRLASKMGYTNYLRNSLPDMWYSTDGDKVKAALQRLNRS